MKTMIAKYPGVCCETGNAIKRGDTIIYYGRGQSALAENQQRTNEDDAAGLERGTLASDRRSARHGLSVIRFNSGEVMTQNSRGRCEDAPCCGCCS